MPRLTLRDVLPLEIRVFSAKPAVKKEHHALVDVVAEAEAAEAESPLAISTNGVLQLEDGVRVRRG
jgi:hypothetical protein